MENIFKKQCRNHFLKIKVEINSFYSKKQYLTQSFTAKNGYKNFACLSGFDKLNVFHFFFSLDKKRLSTVKSWKLWIELNLHLNISENCVLRSKLLCRVYLILNAWSLYSMWVLLNLKINAWSLSFSCWVWPLRNICTRLRSMLDLEIHSTKVLISKF